MDLEALVMENKRARYKKMEIVMTAVLCLDAAIFIAYLIWAGMGFIGLKVTAAILCFLISGVSLYFLYMTKELLRKRSLWMSLAAGCIILCVLFSLVLNFPAPVYVLPQV